MKGPSCGERNEPGARSCGGRGETLPKRSLAVTIAALVGIVVLIGVIVFIVVQKSRTDAEQSRESGQVAEQERRGPERRDEPERPGPGTRQEQDSLGEQAERVRREAPEEAGDSSTTTAGEETREETLPSGSTAPGAPQQDEGASPAPEEASRPPEAMAEVDRLIESGGMKTGPGEDPREDYEAAIELCQAVLRETPQCAEAYHRCGYAQACLAEWEASQGEDSARLFEAAIENFSRAMVFQMMGRRDEALADFKAAYNISRSPWLKEIIDRLEGERKK